MLRGAGGGGIKGIGAPLCVNFKVSGVINQVMGTAKRRGKSLAAVQDTTLTAAKVDLQYRMSPQGAGSLSCLRSGACRQDTIQSDFGNTIKLADFTSCICCISLCH